MDLTRLETLVLDSTVKGLPLATGETLAARDIASRGWNVSDLGLPAVVLRESALAANIATMAEFCRAHDVSHAPHGKTSMAPQLFARQLEAGAWAITAATVAQCRVYRSVGVERILLANELVDPQGLRWIADELKADPGFDFLCYVDSEYGVDLAESIFAEAVVELGVLVEYGYSGGRTGCRSLEDALALVARVQASPHLVLRGVAGYEGLMPGPDVATVMARCEEYLREVRALVDAIPDDGELIVTAGGSSYFDLVTSILGPASFERPVRTVLRSGCYVTHDLHMFETTSPFGSRAGEGAPRLIPAFELWARVLSRPEPGLAILGFGKRDTGIDSGMPAPLSVAGSITAVNDQHAFLRLDDDSLAVGDVVVLGISHPCTTFDKWRYIPLVDDDHLIVDGIFTFF